MFIAGGRRELEFFAKARFYFQLGNVSSLMRCGGMDFAFWRLLRPMASTHGEKPHWRLGESLENITRVDVRDSGGSSIERSSHVAAGSLQPACAIRRHARAVSAAGAS
jgi:hypothetical protein